MKKLFLLSLCLMLCLLFASRLKAQLGEAGSPQSFGLKLKSENIPLQIMPAFDLASLQAEDAVNDAQKGPYRFGYNHIVNLDLLNSGAWTSLPGGDRVWRLELRSPGAQTMNLAFNHYQLPPGAKLFVYNLAHTQVLGAFTAMHNHPDQEMGTDLVTGDDVVVEYDEPASLRGIGYFNIFRVTHGYRSVDYARSFAQAGACIKNVRCPEGNSWSNQRRSVVCLVSGGNEFCSGSLVNNTLNDGTPYILTANHCGTASGSWVFRFNWEAPGCADPATDPSTAQSIAGAVPVASNPASDFDLCKMSSIPPASYQVFYAGWSNRPVPADSVCGIHHPSGDIKKISFAKNAVTATTWGGAQVWQIGQWTDGCTEPGSSGSPLFDQDRRIVGQLFGGPSSCTASAGQDFDYYGRFSISWKNDTLASGRLHDWLDPVNTGATVNDGYDPNGLFVQTISAAAFNFYPNPASETLLISFEEPVDGNITATLYNAMGQIAWSGQDLRLNNQQSFELNLHEFPQGIYWMSMSTNRGVSSREFIIAR